MAPLNRRIVATAAVALVSLTMIASAGAAGGMPERAPQAKSAATWKVGDCFADANVDADEVDLTSKVPCTKDHTVQLVAGAALPTALASLPLATLTSPTAGSRPQLSAFAAQTCAPAAVAKNLYPKQASALAALFAANGVTSDWMVPAAGRMGWALPEPASFAGGATDLLCVYEPDPSITGSSAGDIRRISTRDPLEALRLCFEFNAANDGSEFQPCDKVHDGESLIWLSLPIAGQPADVTTWQDADWAPFDAVCAKFAEVVIGATRTDFIVRADTDAAQPIGNGTRFFNCRTYPKRETAAIPAGVIMTGAGETKVKFAKA